MYICIYWYTDTCSLSQSSVQIVTAGTLMFIFILIFMDWFCPLTCYLSPLPLTWPVFQSYCCRDDTWISLWGSIKVYLLLVPLQLYVLTGWAGDQYSWSEGVYWCPLCACRDASFGNCTYNLTVLDCLQGIRKVSLCSDWLSFTVFVSC